MLVLCLIDYNFSLALGTDDRLLGQAPKVATTRNARVCAHVVGELY
jgi:hypothetical protein